jgi:GT2 family glycosyltransferase
MERVCVETAPEFSVIIVNFNAGAFLQGAIDSLKAQTHRNFEVIVLDNASTDGSADTINTDGLPAFRLMREAENHGFARGNNLAAARARGAWIALLNPDAAANPAWLQEVAAGIRANPGVRAFACAQYMLGQPGLIDGAGDAYFGFGIPWRGGYGHAAVEMPDKDGWCFSGCGASAIYEKALFCNVGGFDERFFCYCEDVDLGFRLQLLGHDCRFLHKAVVHHAGSALSGYKSAFSIFHGTRNRIWTYLKNMPAPVLLATLPGHIVLALYLLLRSSFTPRFRPMLRGITEGVFGAFEIHQSGLWREKVRAAPLVQLLQRMSWDPKALSSRKVHIRRSKD